MGKKVKKVVDTVAPPDYELELVKLEAIANALEQQRNNAANDVAKLAGQVAMQMKQNHRLHAKFEDIKNTLMQLEVKIKDLEKPKDVT